MNELLKAKLLRLQDGFKDMVTVCNKASTEDGVGFSGADLIGHTLAVLPIENWNKKCRTKAVNMANKYRGQLGFQIEFTPEERAWMLEARKEASIKDGFLIVKFEYNPETVTLIKGSGLGFRWNGVLKFWYTNQITQKALDWLSANGFDIPGDEIEDIEIEPETTAPVIKEPTEKMYVEGNKLIIQFAYNPLIVTDVKALDDRKFNPEKKNWTVNLKGLEGTEDLNKLYEISKTYKFVLSPEVLSLFEQKPAVKVAHTINQAKYDFPFEIKDYQLTGAEFLIKEKLAFLGDTMGLGKTVQCLLAMVEIGKFPALGIVPNGLKYNWEQEAKLWFPNLKVQVINSTDKIIPGRDLYIINYDILTKFKAALIELKPHFVFLDESHMIKDSKTLRFKNCKEIMETINPEYRVLMSGTIFTNRPKEMVPQLEVLGTLHRIVRKKWDFFIKYCGATRNQYGWELGGATNTRELYQKLANTFYLRREKEQVLRQLPDKTYNVIPLEITNRKEYDKAEADLRAYLQEQFEEGKTDKPFSGAAEHLVQIEKLKQITLEGKKKAIIEWVENFIDQEKLVLFVHHKSIVDDLLKAFPDALTIVGDDKVIDRQAAINQFQKDPDKRLIICSIKSASVGITLTASSNVAFIELPWQPGDLNQAIDRVHRIGQDRGVNVYYLLGHKTIEDQKIYPLIKSKQKVFDEVARGLDTAVPTGILKDFILSIIAA